MPSIEPNKLRSDLVRQDMAPAADFLPTPDALKSLKIPDSVALRPENVIPFLAGQSLRYNEIVNRPEIKTLAGDIPIYVTDDNPALNVSPEVSRDAQANFQSWSGQAFLGIQSGEVKPAELLSQVDDYVKEAQKNQPDLIQQAASNRGDPTDPTNMMLLQATQETEEERKKWQQALASASDPELFNAILGMRLSSKYMKEIGKLTQRQAFLIQERDKVFKDLGLEGKGTSQSQLAQANMKFASFQGDVSSNMMEIQKAMTDYQRIIEFTSTSNTQVRRPLEVMLNNMK